MKTLKAEYMLIAVLVIGVAAIGTSLQLSNFDNGALSISKSGAKLMGHTVMIVTDSDGHVIAYRQSDNAIVQNGMAILASQTFADFNTTSGMVNWMQIGTGGETAPTSSQTALVTPIGGCNRIDAAFSTAGPVDAGGFARISVNGTATFQGSACAASSIDEAGVFNLSSGGEMFARNIFSNPVTLQTSDQLTVNWDFVFTDS